MQKLMTLAIGILWLGGCTAEGPTSERPDTAAPDDEDEVCAEDGDCGAYEICEAEACVLGDRDDTFEDAPPIFQVRDADDPNVSRGMIHEAGDLDHYAYTATGPEWLRVWTRTDDVPEGLDTVLSVYAPNGALHDAVDDFATGRIRGFDSRMYVYLPSAGTWYFRVEDHGTWYDEEPAAGGRSFTYELGIEAWTSVSQEPDSAEDPTISYEVANGSTIYPWGFLIEEPGDVDHAAITLPWAEAPLEIAAATETPGSPLRHRVEAYDPEGVLRLAKDDVGPDGLATYLDAVPGTWRVSVSDVDGAGSDQHWGVLYLRTREEGSGNPREEEPNDTAAQPVELDQERVQDGGDTLDRAFLQGVLSTPDDVDFYSIDVAEGGRLRLVCSSSRLGSLGDVEVEVIGPGDTSLGVFSDGDDSAPDIEGLEDLPAGGYLLRFFEADGAGSPSVYYRCGVYVDLP